MALELPASIQGLVGRRLARIFISDQRDRLAFDTYATASTSRTRYAYLVDGTVDRIYNHASMVGRVVSSVESLDPEANGQYKILLRTDGQDGFGLIYLSGALVDIGIITEQGDSVEIILEQDSQSILIREQDESVDGPALTDTDLGRNPPYKASDDGTTYRVEEDDVDYWRWT